MPGKLRDSNDWTVIRDIAYYNALLEEKAKLFQDFCISFPGKIETQFWANIIDGTYDPEVYLDNLCRDHLKQALDNYPKAMLK